MTDNYEFVEHPPHYNNHPSGVECIDIIQHYPYNVGAAMKYLWRAGLKPGTSDIEDYRKAIFYINQEIRRLRKLSEDNLSGLRRGTDPD